MKEISGALVKPENKGLRLMVYDASDRTTNLKKIRAGISGEANELISTILPDDIEDADFDVPLGMTHTWIAGGRLYRLLGRIDKARGFYKWEDALRWLATFAPEQKIDEIQFWGHGSPGHIWMLEDQALNYWSARGPKFEDLMTAVRDRLTPESHIWLRACGVFRGHKGHHFAEAWSEFFGCRISAHTHVIGFWQSGLRSVMPGETPHWSKEDGGVSGRKVPNTITCLHNEVPREW